MQVLKPSHRYQPRAMVIACGLVAAASAVPDAGAQTLTDPALEVTEIVAALSQPTAMALLPPSPGATLELLVAEKATGRVVHVRDGAILGIALDLPVNSRSERGLLGLALHPAFTSNGFVYLYYTASSTGADNTDQSAVAAHRVQRYVWDGATLTAPTLLLELPATPGPNHDGGVLLFGPDGMLYGVIGDLNRNGQLQNFPSGPAADDTGIVFRLHDDGSVPVGNPFVDLGGAMAKVFAYGVRNSFGMDFDPQSQVLWDSENGPDRHDEINRVPGGFNSGWEQIMGPDAQDPQNQTDLWAAAGSQYADPLFSWLAPIGVTAIHFVRTAILGPGYTHDLLVGDNNTGGLYRFEASADRTSLVMPTPETADRVADNAAERDVFRIGSGFGVVTDIETGADGVYVCSLSNGRIYRIRRDPTPAQAADWGHVKDLFRPR